MMAKQRMNSEERRASIIEAAITIIAQTSFERCTTALIAKEAGVSEPMIYRHFKSKKNLQVAVLDTILNDISVFTDKNIRGLPSITVSKISDYGKAFRREAQKNPKRVAVLVKSIALEDEDAREKVWEILQSLHMVMKTMLNKLPAKEDNRSDDMINMLSWVMLSWVSVTSAVNLLGRLDEIPEDQIDSRVSFIEDMLNDQAYIP